MDGMLFNWLEIRLKLKGAFLHPSSRRAWNNKSDSRAVYTEGRVVMKRRNYCLGGQAGAETEWHKTTVKTMVRRVHQVTLDYADIAELLAVVL